MPWRAAGERLAIEVVRRLGGRKARVLADRPRPDRVHRRLRAADVGREPGQRVGRRQAFQIGRGVERLDDDAVGRVPVERGEVGAGRRARGGGAPGGERFGVGGGRRFQGGSSERLDGHDYRGRRSDNPGHAAPARQPDRRRRPRRRHRPCRRAAGPPSRRPAAPQADHDGRADRDGQEDLGFDRPRPARPDQHRVTRDPAFRAPGARGRGIARRRARPRGWRAACLRPRRRARSTPSPCRSPTSCC